MIERLNLRVYGILLNNNGEVLLSDENRFGMQYTKFPGGGLELGEGISDCLKREFIEELGLEIDILEHYYTTDFLQVSAFDKKDQIISVYYLVKFKNEESITLLNTKEKKFQFDGLEQIFRWRKISELNEKELTFPIDKIVGEMLKLKEK